MPRAYSGQPYTLFCSAGRIRIASDGQMQFVYKPQPDVECSFSLLNECGETWRRGFKHALDTAGLLADSRDLPHAPWVASFAVEKGV